MYLCDPIDCNLPDSSIHGIFQARILEWFAISFSQDLPDSGIEPGFPALQADSLPLCHRGSLILPSYLTVISSLGFSGGSMIKKPPANAGGMGSTPGSGRSPGEGNGNSLQCSCLENSMNRGSWKATVHGAIKESDQTSWLKQWQQQQISSLKVFGFMGSFILMNWLQAFIHERTVCFKF